MRIHHMFEWVLPSIAPCKLESGRQMSPYESIYADAAGFKLRTSNVSRLSVTR